MPTPGTAPHENRQIAESFGTDPERYDRTRPQYPTALVDAVMAASPGHTVLDVGSGTGTAARQFQAAGCEVLAVEPDARMAEWARRFGLAVEVSTFEAWEPAGRTFDTIIAGQSWHWVDPIAGAAKAAETLRPGGLLALFWHAPELPPEVTKSFAEAHQRAMPDSPFTMPSTGKAVNGYRTMAATAAEGLRTAGGFDDPDLRLFEWERTYTRDEWLDQLPTSGALTRLPPEKLAEVLAAAGDAIEVLGGAFHLPYTTVTLLAARAA
jgi:SAM-dependent methyltransferase